MGNEAARAALVERVARAIYERCKRAFADDPATVSICGDFANDVFPPWEETNQEPYISDAIIALDIALEGAARVAEQTAPDALACNIAAAIRALVKP